MVFWFVFSHVAPKVRVYSRAKAGPRLKQKTMGERARGEGSEKNRLQSTPRDFWNCARCLDAGSCIPDWPRECQPVSGCQIPSGYKLQRSTVGWNAAYLIYVRSKKYPPSVLDTSRESSTVLKLQRIILKSKRGAVSERKIFLKKEKTYLAHL